MPTKPQQQFQNLVQQSGRTYRELAERLGVSRSYIGERVAGRRAVRPLDVLAMERLIEIEPPERPLSWERQTVKSLRARGYRAQTSGSGYVIAWGEPKPEVSGGRVEAVEEQRSGGGTRTGHRWHVHPA